MKNLGEKNLESAFKPIDFTKFNPESQLNRSNKLIQQVRLFLEDCNELSTEQFLETAAIFQEQMARIEKPVEHLTKVVDSSALKQVYQKIRVQHLDAWSELMNHSKFSQCVLDSDLTTIPAHYHRLIIVQRRNAHAQGIHLDSQKSQRLNSLNRELIQLQSEFRAKVTQASSVFPELMTTVRTSSDTSNRRDAWMERYTLNTKADLDTRKIISQEMCVRTEIAKLQGYRTFADFQANSRAAGSAQNIEKFLKNTAEYILPAARNRINIIAQFARSQGHMGTSLEPWDIEFWTNRYINHRWHYPKTDRSDDTFEQYSELESVLGNLLKIISELFGIEFKNVTDEPVWHKDVRIIDWYDPSGKPMGRQYLDLFHRPGTKSIGAWKSSIYHGSANSCDPEIPICSLQTNFSPRPGKNPVLLSWDQIRTLFHEFGHCLHELCCQQYFSCLGGTQVVRDVLEYPSSFMELFLRFPQVIQRVGRHWKTGQKIPTSLVKNMLEVDSYLRPINYLRRLSLGMFDFEFHNREPGNIAEIHELFKKTSLHYGLQAIPDSAWPETSFNHIFAGDYAVGYYGYLYALLYAEDALSVFRNAKDPIDSVLGSRFRRFILSQGNSQSMTRLHELFMGKRLSGEAYYQSLR